MVGRRVHLSRILGALLALGLLTSLPATTWAHGPQPAAVKVLATDKQGPVLIQLSDGLALRRQGSWRYVCQALWDGPLSPQVVALDENRIFIVGTLGLYRLGAQGHILGPEQPDLSALQVQELAVAGTRVVALWNDGVNAHLTDATTSAGVALWQGVGDWTGLAADASSVDLASVDLQGNLLWSHLSLTQGLAATSTVPLQQPGATVRLRREAGSLYGLVYSGEFALLGTLNLAAEPTPGQDSGILAWHLLAKTYRPLDGPLQLGDQLLVAENGILRRVQDGGLQTVDDTRWYSCLGRSDAGPYFCALTEITGLGAQGQAQKSWFTLAMLDPPLTDGLSGDRAFNCTASWQNFAFDGGLNPAGANPIKSEAPASSCNVNRRLATSEPKALLLTVLPLMSSWLLARRRKAQAPGPWG